LKPSYDQKFFPGEAKSGKLALIASPDGRDGSMRIEQDATLYASWLTTGESVRHELAPGRHAWLQVARGTLKLGGKTLNQGDGAAVSNETALVIEGQTDEGAEFLLFDLN
jgi:redox-sensitive bicupin YhaK (pirin superfamily)